MRRNKALVCFFALFALLAVVVFSVENVPHAFKQCGSCHAVTNPSGTGGPARRMIKPVTTLCAACHEKTLSEGYMHPVDVRPARVAVPRDMPLSPSGEIQCSTCHDVHSAYLTPYGAPSHFLRRQEQGKAFCSICHGNLDSLSKGHRASLGEAHFRSKYVATDARQEIDAMSRNCVSCHDGTYAASVSIRAGAWRHSSGLMPHDKGSHPIGVDYESVRLNRGSKTDLKPISQVDPLVRFFDGKVGCGSCHDPYSDIPNQLVMSDENSKLCFACHLL